MHVTIWFYFFPFIALVATYMIPIYYKTNELDTDEEAICI